MKKDYMTIIKLLISNIAAYKLFAFFYHDDSAEIVSNEGLRYLRNNNHKYIINIKQ